MILVRLFAHRTMYGGLNACVDRFSKEKETWLASLRIVVSCPDL